MEVFIMIHIFMHSSLANLNQPVPLHVLFDSFLYHFSMVFSLSLFLSPFYALFTISL